MISAGGPAVREVIEYADDAGGGSTTIIDRPPIEGAMSDLHSVDVGDLSYAERDVTHRTRDGQPIIAAYSVEHGWQVMVHTGEVSQNDHTGSHAELQPGWGNSL